MLYTNLACLVTSSTLKGKPKRKCLLGGIEEIFSACFTKNLLRLWSHSLYFFFTASKLLVFTLPSLISCISSSTPLFTSLTSSSSKFLS